MPEPLYVFALVAGSLAPDIDGGGTISQPAKFAPGVPKILGSVVNGVTGTLSKFIRGTAGHRGFFHWPLLAVTIMIAGTMLHSPFVCWFGLGYASHLAADALTVEGIPLFAPLSFERHSARLFRTGSFLEFLLVACIGVATVYWGFALLPHWAQKGYYALRHIIIAPQKPQ